MISPLRDDAKLRPRQPLHSQNDARSVAFIRLGNCDTSRYFDCHVQKLGFVCGWIELDTIP